jgi:glycosyltransferase involved in cell wall biosynthesis
MTLGILYHMPFWRDAEGRLWEAEGSFARYVDSLAPYFDEVVLSVPVFDRPQASGSRVRSANVRIAALPYFPGPRQFYPMLPRLHRLLRRWVKQCDVVHLRVPSPAAIFAFRLAMQQRKPVFLLVVGDYEALLPHLPYKGIKKQLFSWYVAFEEWAVRRMTTRSLTFANGAALREKHEAQGATVFETKTTTLSLSDVDSRADTCQSPRLRLLTVSRIDPRKGLRVLPEAIAELVSGGLDVTLDIVGPTIGAIGDDEKAAIAADAARLGVADRVRLTGAIALDQLITRYREYDLFVLPTRPGEGVPRVLMEAMANGLPVITTRVSGIGSLVTHGQNGFVIDEPTPGAVARAVRLLIDQPGVRRAIIQGGYKTARAHTLERQAAQMMRIVSEQLRLPIRAPRVA